jgi:hypothetical protein
MATVAQVIDRTGNELGLLRLNQSLQAQDATRIEAAYNEVYAMLRTKGYTPWSIDGVIPAELVAPVVALMADNCLGTYSVSNDRFQRIKLESVPAVRKIGELIDSNYYSSEEPEDF